MDWITISKDEHSSVVECIVEIRDNKTGEIVRVIQNETLDNDDKYPNVFNWEENNYSCDCNRHIIFNNAKGIKNIDIACSDGNFSVNLINNKDGKIYYKEF